jgi:hypothetical protein
MNGAKSFRDDIWISLDQYPGILSFDPNLISLIPIYASCIELKAAIEDLLHKFQIIYTENKSKMAVYFD